MARGIKAKTQATDLNISDDRHDATRKNDPPAKIAAEGCLPAVPNLPYRRGPRGNPVLRRDPTGGADRLPGLPGGVRRRPSPDEAARLLAEGPRHQRPGLERTVRGEARGGGIGAGQIP